MFTCLRHRTVCCGYYQNRSVHLSRTRNHVLDIVGVARAVYVGIVTVVRLVFNVRRINRNTACTLFRRLVDVRVIYEFRIAFLSQYFRDCRCQGRFTMVYVTNRSDVAVWLTAFKLLFCHEFIP